MMMKYPDPTSEPPTPTITDGYGTLVAVKSVTTFDPGFGVPVTEIDMGIASAAFTDGTNYDNFVNAGVVEVEGQELSQFDNNSYVFTPSQTDPTGIEYSSSPEWVVGGAGDIPGFTHTVGINFPTVGDINSSTTVPSSGDFTVSVPNVSGADSVYFMLGGVIHIEAGNVTSSTFTEAEIDGMSSGASFAQVAPYKIESDIYSGKTFYFVTEKVVTQSVTIE